MATVTRLGTVGGWHNYVDSSNVNYPSVDPPGFVTQFGFNIFVGSGITTYTTGGPLSGENATSQIARLVADYGNFDDGKIFYTSGGFNLPSVWNTTIGGGPNTHMSVCFSWTIGTISDGSHDAAITAYCQSVPAGKTVRLCWNEADYKILDGTIPSASGYVADMNHLYDLVHAMSGLSATIEVWDCFGEFHLEAGQTFSNSWTNPAKRDGIIWDCYQNNATTDTSGTAKVGLITAKMNELGMTRWIVGEHGDRRQQDSYTPAANLNQTGHCSSDSQRAGLWTNRIGAFLAADPPPEAITIFDVVGTTGDHRIITWDAGGTPDSATKAVLAGFRATARGE
jgi:hypothetical protein